MAFARQIFEGFAVDDHDTASATENETGVFQLFHDHVDGGALDPEHLGKEFLGKWQRVGVGSISRLQQPLQLMVRAGAKSGVRKGRRGRAAWWRDVVGRSRKSSRPDLAKVLLKVKKFLASSFSCASLLRTARRRTRPDSRAVGVAAAIRAEEARGRGDASLHLADRFQMFIGNRHASEKRSWPADLSQGTAPIVRSA